MGWKKNRGQGDLAFEGGFWEWPVLGDMANVIASAAVDVAGVSGEAAKDVATLGSPKAEEVVDELTLAVIRGDTDAIQVMLDTWGLEPTTGWLGDLASGAISIGEGEWGDMATSFASTFPFIDIATKPKKIADGYKKVKKSLDVVEEKIKKSDSFKNSGKIDSDDLKKALKDEKIPKNIQKDILDDKKFIDNLGDMGLDTKAIEGITNPPGKFKSFFKYMNKPSETSLFGYRDKPWVQLPFRGGKGFKPWEKMVGTNLALNLIDPQQGYFSDRGLSGQSSGNLLGDLLYSSTVKAPFEYGYPLAKFGGMNIANTIGYPFGVTPEGAFGESVDYLLQDKYDSTGMKIGESYPFSSEILNPIDPDAKPTSKNTENLKNPDIELTANIKRNYQGALIDLLIRTQGDERKQSLKIFYEQLPENHKKYILEEYPRHFGKFK